MTSAKPKDRHRPHYVHPKRERRRPVVIYLEDAEHAAVKEITARRGTTVQDTGEELFRAFLQQAAPRPR